MMDFSLRAVYGPPARGRRRNAGAPSEILILPVKARRLLLLSFDLAVDVALNRAKTVLNNRCESGPGRGALRASHSPRRASREGACITLGAFYPLAYVSPTVGERPRAVD